MQAIFDFDRTLSREMVYNNLGGPDPDAALAKPASWWSQQFGGHARISMLRTMLGRLREMGVELFICSHNHPEVITIGLGQVQLDEFFLPSRVSGRGARAGGGKSMRRKTPICPGISSLLSPCFSIESKAADKGRKKSNSKAGRMQPLQIIGLIGGGGWAKGPRVRRSLQDNGVDSTDAAFVDDDGKNCQEVSRACPGICCVHCDARAGLTAQELQLLIEFFSSRLALADEPNNSSEEEDSDSSFFD